MRRPSSRTASVSGETAVPRVAVSPFTDTLPAEIRASAFRREGAAPARARKAWRRISRGLGEVRGPGLAGLLGEALPHAGELLLADERVKGREVLTGGGTGDDEELVGHVEESRGTGMNAVGVHLGEEATVEKVTDHGVGVDAAHLGYRTARQGAVVEVAREHLVSGTGERRGACLLAETLDGGGADGICREQVAARHVAQHDARVFGREALSEVGEGQAYLLLGEAGGGAQSVESEWTRAR